MPETEDTKIPLKTDVVLRSLRGRIVSGAYAPGMRLPTFDELESDFGVSRAVLQAAVGRLQRDGFLRTVNRQGIFVVDAPPHLARYGLVFADHPNTPGWSRFCTALASEAHRAETEKPGRHVVVYHGVQESEAGRESLRRLRHDVEAERLAGLILNAGTHPLRLQPPFNRSDLPKAFMLAAFDAPFEPKVETHRDQLYLRALQELATRGRRRIAVIDMADLLYRLEHDVFFHQVGLPLHRPWLQKVGRSQPEVVRGLIPLLMDYPPEQRPDGLIIADDNLVEHACAGLLDAGMRVGVDLDVVAHCNWPWPVPSVLPLLRIGFDARDMLRRALACIDDQRAGRTPPAEQKVPALFESEIQG